MKKSYEQTSTKSGRNKKPVLVPLAAAITTISAAAFLFIASPKTTNAEIIDLPPVSMHDSTASDVTHTDIIPEHNNTHGIGSEAPTIYQHGPSGFIKHK